MQVWWMRVFSLIFWAYGGGNFLILDDSGSMGLVSGRDAEGADQVVGVLRDGPSLRPVGVLRGRTPPLGLKHGRDRLSGSSEESWSMEATLNQPTCVKDKVMS